MLPDVGHRQDAERVQRRERAAAPQFVRCVAAGERGERDVDRAQGEERGRRGDKVDGEAADEPRQRSREQNGEYRQQPGVIQQVDARVVPGECREGLGCVAVIHGCLALERASPEATSVESARRKLLPSRNGRAGTLPPLGCWNSLTCRANACGRSTWL